ncbi:MAG TPA: ferredoxin [Anaerolineaceae bacterium]|nr:ferredoxin [Anaerolineaceae bacterium]
MNVFVDPDTCMGCGVCETIAPEIFQLGDQIHAIVIMDPVPESYRDLVQQAVDECPEEAISFED